MVRPASPGRTAICRARSSNRGAYRADPRFSVSAQHHRRGRRDSSSRTHHSRLRHLRTARWQKIVGAPLLSDCHALVRRAQGTCRAACQRRLRTHHSRHDAALRIRFNSRRRLALARRRRHRSSRSRSIDARHPGRTRSCSRSPACRGPRMMMPGRPAKILLIDSNVYFSKRLGDALKREGFEVKPYTQASFALTTLEYDTPAAILCATNMREMGALEMARIIHADPKNVALMIIALGDGSQRPLMEAFQAGCDDYIDRHLAPPVIATHVKNIIVSKANGFQPTQMLTQSDTSLSGSLTHHDLPGVMQMLGHAHQTGALHITAGETDAVLFFDAGEISHAECGNLFGDEAVIHILKNCVENNSGVYKFAYGMTSSQRTVLRSATDLMLDAMREVDEASRDTADKEAQ